MPVSAIGVASATVWATTCKACATGAPIRAEVAASPTRKASASTWDIAIRKTTCWGTCSEVLRGSDADGYDSTRLQLPLLDILTRTFRKRTAYVLRWSRQPTVN